MKLIATLLCLTLLFSISLWAAPSLVDPEEYEAMMQKKAQEGKPPPGSDPTERYKTNMDTQRQKSTTQSERAASTTDSTRQTREADERKRGQAQERQKGNSSSDQRRNSDVNVP